MYTLNIMFNRSRSNLALWFTLTMGSILVIFAGILYYREVLNELEDIDRLLEKKSRVMAVNAKYDPLRKQLDLEHVPLLGSQVPPLGSEVVYARWYNTKGEILQFFGIPPKERLLTTPGFYTIKAKLKQTKTTDAVTWLRELTIPIYQDSLLIGYLQIAIPLTPTQNDLAQLRLILLLTVPATLGVISLTGWWLGGIAMQPILNSYEQLQRFTADASHELRSPMSAIVSNAQYGLLSANPEVKQQRFEKIVEIARYMSNLVNNLLFLARHAGRLPSESLQEVDLRSEIIQIADEFATLEISQHLNLIYNLPTSSVIVLGDSDLLHQAIVNLLTNACKYTPAGGQVKVELHTQPYSVVIEVTDNGIGMTKADLPHIFERFYRVDKKRSRKTGGYGLGLSIVQEIVFAHRGNISVKSVVDKGTTFKIIIPLK